MVMRTSASCHPISHRWLLHDDCATTTASRIGELSATGWYEAARGRREHFVQKRYLDSRVCVVTAPRVNRTSARRHYSTSIGGPEVLSAHRDHFSCAARAIGSDHVCDGIACSASAERKRVAKPELHELRAAAGDHECGDARGGHSPSTLGLAGSLRARAL